MKWTPEQQTAIYQRNPATLVSAAAGSGKTAVLIQRIYSLLEEDRLELDRMLVVTFTRAAAAEMRERLSKKLHEGAAQSLHIQNQLDKLDRASISTLHVFCSQVLREFFHLVNMDPTAKIVEGGERDYLMDQALLETLEEAYEKAEPPFVALAQRYTDKVMIELVQSLYAFLMAQPQPFAWLNHHLTALPATPQQLMDHPWVHSLCADLLIDARGALDLAEEMAILCEGEDAIDYCREVSLADFKLSDDLCTVLEKKDPDLWVFADEVTFLPLTRVPRKKTEAQALWYEEYKKKRKQWKDLFQKILPLLPKNMGATLEDIQSTRLPLEGLAALTRSFYEHFSALKKDRNLFDFYDLEHQTLVVLQNPEAQSLLQGRFDAIFVDEYQDISGIQEAILQKLHQHNQLFMVGDVKQSIYRFRLADPTLFLDKYRRFSKDEKAKNRKIDLQKNFRSAPQVLQGVNEVFERVMNRAVTEIDYDDEAKLIAGLPYDPYAEVALYINLPQDNPPVDRDDKDDQPEEETPLTKIEQEATIIAQYFTSLYGKPVIKNGQEQALTWRDMVVLLPKAKNVAKKVATILQSKGIPVYSDADEEYFSLPEVDQVMAFLRIVDNPFQDYPLLQVLKSSPFYFTEEELSAIRLFSPNRGRFFHENFFELLKEDSPLGQRCKKAYNQIDYWQKQAAYLSLDKFLWQLLWDTSLYTLSGAMAGGEVRQGNLRLLCQRGHDFYQNQQGTLHDFLLLGATLQSYGDNQTAKVLGEGEDVVRLMTIHKSKGLEFPVVAVMELGSRLHGRPNHSDLCLHKSLGLAINYLNPQKRIKRNTLGQQALQLRSKLEEKAEKARLLYVAMTRAKNKLLLVGSLSRLSAAWRWGLPPGPYSIAEAASLLDWVAQALFFKEEGAPLRALVNLENSFSTASQQGVTLWNIKTFANISLLSVDNFTSFHQLQNDLLALGNRPVFEPLFPFYLPEERQKAAPLKTSVSSLTKKEVFPARYIPSEEETTLTKGKGEILTLPLQLSPIAALPAFLQENPRPSPQPSGAALPTRP